jgi:hypothetical protein
MNTNLNRRNILRGTGTLIALPALESIAFRRFASAAGKAPAKPPKRMVFLGFGFGVTQETWFPSVEQTGADYDLPEGLRPLSRHKENFTVVQGCSNQFSNEAHWGNTFWLTGANRFAVPGQSMANIVSADDPPIFMSYGMSPTAKLPSDPKRVRGWLIHHVNLGIALKEKTDSLNLEAHLKYPGARTSYDSLVAFFADKLLDEERVHANKQTSI